MKKWWPAIVAVLILIIGIFVYIYFFHSNTTPMLADIGSKDEEKVEHKDEEKVVDKSIYLIYGRDMSSEEGKTKEVKVETDLIITATLDPVSKTIDILFIPPNTVLEDNQEVKIIYDKEGIAGLKAGIEKLTGKKINGYIGIDYQPFVQLIDILGGIQVRMDESIDLPKYGLFIHPGINKLNGEETLKLLRLKRSKTNVLERIERQKKVIMAIYERLIEIKNFSQIQKVGDAVLQVREKLETDIESAQILKGFKFFSQGIEKVNVEILPGELINGLWIPAE
ncbi:hypothetical protein BBF96_10005 [Anoxybacter fermentans]|uniref:Cell envelope-related transcriptional attenuator domain-containing protein n=1 Tax=Anoxybacter fermentans TaxID=1323375 RepID=A0A3S9SZG6_9FIRM|nr:LCP family protein [Anoxybacter fermentans]AZR73685.1 hypothetical protein BBF96_10005 [Anoxybacter fermentans]